MLTEVQKIILTCLLGPEDKTAFKREKRRLQRADYRAKNQMAIKEADARYYVKNSVEIKEAEARYYAKNREKVLLRHKEYHAKNREKVLLRQKEYRVKNPGYYLERDYGISFAERQKMLDKQSGLCAICGVFMKTPHVDHCHATGKIRGLLCYKCNSAIGLLQDNSAICCAAGDYLERSK